VLCATQSPLQPTLPRLGSPPAKRRQTIATVSNWRASQVSGARFSRALPYLSAGRRAPTLGWELDGLMGIAAMSHYADDNLRGQNARAEKGEA
jgi:hypothetical protein